MAKGQSPLTTESLLERLFQGAIADAKNREADCNFGELEVRLASAPPVRDAYRALAASSDIAVIAEIKRASPSKGDIAPIPDAALLARSYAAGGADAISVLTEPYGFKGSLQDLTAVRAAVELPILRKDFLANRYQVLESRVFGADLILLILAWLDDDTARDLFEFAHSLGMGVLVETHNEDEVRRAKALGARLVGINARDLSTFETDRKLFGSLASSLPASVIKVAESAVRGSEDVRAYREAGADAVLVGEALVRGDASALLRDFKAAARA